MSVLVKQKFVSQKPDSFGPIKNSSDVLIARPTRKPIILNIGFRVISQVPFEERRFKDHLSAL